MLILIINNNEKIIVSLPKCSLSTEKCILDNSTKLSDGTYCIDNEKGKIYLGTDTSSGACSVKFGDKNYNEAIIVFDVTEPHNAKLVNIKNDELTDKKLVLYDCAYNSCQQTYGYIIQKDGGLLECGTKTCTTITETITVCNEDTVGQVMYTDMDGYQMCVLEDIRISVNGLPVSTYTFKPIIGTDHHYTLNAYTTYDTNFFGGDYEYFNSTLVKTQENMAVLTMRSKYI